MIEVKWQGTKKLTKEQKKSVFQLFYQISAWWKSKTLMWNFTRKQKVIIYKDGKPIKKLYLKDRTKLDKYLEKLNG